MYGKLIHVIFPTYPAQDYCNAIRIVCQNRCRIRRSFTNIIRDLDVLQHRVSKISQSQHFPTEVVQLVTEYFLDMDNGFFDVEEVTKELCSTLKWNILLAADRFGSWILESIHRLGFEEDIYHAHELSHMYQ